MANVFRSQVDATITVTYEKTALFDTFEVRVWEQGEDKEEAEIFQAEGLGAGPYTIFLPRSYRQSVGAIWHCEVRTRNTDGQTNAWESDTDTDPGPGHVAVAETEESYVPSDYLTKDGARELTNDWDAGPWQIKAESFYADGSGQPYFCDSTVLCTNLNADLLDGQHYSDLQAEFSPIAGSSSIVTVGTIASGIWQGTVIDSEYIDQSLAVASLTATGTVQAEHLYSTDDAVIDGDITADRLYLEGGKYLIWEDATKFKMRDVDNTFTFFSFIHGSSLTIAASTEIILRSVNASQVRPYIDGDTYLGHSSYRWETVYAYDGDFTGDVTVAGTVQAEHLYSTDDAVIDDRLGIGKALPAGPLDIEFTTSGAGYVYFYTNVSGNNPASSAGLFFGWNKSGGQGESIIGYDTQLGAGARLDFARWNGSTYYTEMTLRLGKVGIGNNNPSYTLDVTGDIRVTDDLFVNDNVYLNSDDARVYLGADNDMYLVHTGTQGYLINLTGVLSVKATATDLWLQEGQSNDVVMFPTTTGNPYFYRYGYDSGTSSVKYGRDRIAADGSWYIESEEAMVLQTTGASGVNLQYSAAGNVTFFLGAGAGENPYVYTYGDKSGTVKWLRQSVSTGGAGVIEAQESFVLRATGNMYFDATSDFLWRDKDAAYANRMTLNSATGDLWLYGDADIDGELNVDGWALIDDGMHIGPARNVNALKSSFGFHDADGSTATYTQLVEEGWGGGHALLWNAYKYTHGLTGGLATTGKLKYANVPGAYSSGAGMLQFDANAGTIYFRISPESTGQDDDIVWGSAVLTLKRAATATFGGAVYIPEYLYHTGDTDTYIRYQENQIQAYVGGASVLNAYASNTDINNDAHADVRLFAGAGAGENRYWYIYGDDGGVVRWGRHYVDSAGSYRIESEEAMTIRSVRSLTMDSATGGGYHTYLRTGGIFYWQDRDDSNQTRLSLDSSSGQLTMMPDAASGDNPSFYIYGYDTGASAKKYGRHWIATSGTYNVKAEEAYLLAAGGGFDVTWQAGGDFSMQDVDAAGADRWVLDSSTGDVTMYGDLELPDGGTITTTTNNLILKPAGDIILDPDGMDVLPESGYEINLGTLQKKYLTLHCAELWVETLVAQDTIATIGGRVLVGPTTVLTSDLSDSATTIYVKHNQMTSGDRVYMEANMKVEFMAITSGASGEGPYSYTVTRNLDDSGANTWYAGDAVFNTGQTGKGFIDLYSISGVSAASTTGPTIVGNVRNSATYNDWSEYWAIGNLDGLYGYGTDTYGLGLGKYSATSAYITIDATDGYRIHGDDRVVAQWDNDGLLHFFDSGDVDRMNIGDFSGVDTDYGVKVIDNGGIWLQRGHTSDVGGWSILLDDTGATPGTDTYHRTGILMDWAAINTTLNVYGINATIATTSTSNLGDIYGSSWVVGKYNETANANVRRGVYVNLKGNTTGMPVGVYSTIYNPNASATVYAGYFQANVTGGGGPNPDASYGIYVDGIGGGIWAAGHIVLANGTDIILETDAGSDLGATGERFNILYVDDVVVTDDVTIGDDLTISGKGTFNSTAWNDHITVTRSAHGINITANPNGPYFSPVDAADHLFVSFAAMKPSSDGTHELGTSALRWEAVYAYDGNFSDDVKVGDDIIFTHATQGAILSNTSDGSDTKEVIVCGGGGASISRGGYVLLWGNEHAQYPGKAALRTGSVAGALLELYNNANTWFLDESGHFYPNSSSYTMGTSSKRIGVVYAIDGNFSDDVTVGDELAVTGFIKPSAAIIGQHVSWFDLYQNTSDGSDTKATRIGGGGDVTSSRGAFATFHGNEHANYPGELWLNAGDINADMLFTTYGTGSFIFNTGKMGIGTDPFDTFHIRREYAATTHEGVLRVELYDTGTLADGEGPKLWFSIGESGDEDNNIGAIAVVRDGANTEGKMLFFAGTNGAEEFMSIAADGEVTAAGLLSADGGIEIPSGENKLRVNATGGICIYTNELNVQDSGNLYLGHRTTAGVRVSVHFQPTTDNAVMLGGSSNRWSTIYSYDGNFADDVTVGDDLKLSSDSGTLFFGADDDMSMYHDGASGYILSNTGNLYLYGNMIGFNYDARGDVSFFQGSGAGENRKVYVYGDVSGTARSTWHQVDTGGGYNITSYSYITLNTGAGGHLYWDFGGTQYWRDIDDSNANRMTLDSATGNLWIDGNLDVDGGLTIGATLLIPTYLQHVGDADTWLYFTTNQIQMTAGGGPNFYIDDSNVTVVGDFNVSSGDEPMVAQAATAVTSTVLTGLTLRRGVVSGVGATGAGVSLDFDIENSAGGSVQDAGRFLCKFTDATSTTEDSQFEWYTRTNGASNLAMYLTDAGQLYTDSNTGFDSIDDPDKHRVQLFDEEDDAGLLELYAKRNVGGWHDDREGISRLVKLGVLVPKPYPYRGFMVDHMTLFQLFAGGIYQNAYRISMAERRVFKLEDQLETEQEKRITAEARADEITERLTNVEGRLKVLERKAA